MCTFVQVLVNMGVIAWESSYTFVWMPLCALCSNVRACVCGCACAESKKKDTLQSYFEPQVQKFLEWLLVTSRRSQEHFREKLKPGLLRSHQRLWFSLARFCLNFEIYNFKINISESNFFDRRLEGRLYCRVDTLRTARHGFEPRYWSLAWMTFDVGWCLSSTLIKW